jgi:hypothetical protein
MLFTPLRVLTLILAGDDDPIIPLVNARVMHRLIPRSQLHAYHGGHLELAVHAKRVARSWRRSSVRKEPTMSPVANRRHVICRQVCTLDQLLDALAQGERGTGDEHSDGRDQRPEIGFPPVPRGCRSSGGRLLRR